MKISDVRNYLLEKGFEIRLTNKYVDVINYKEIGNFDASNITIYYNGGKVKISGNNMTINKLMDNEIFVVGNIINIELG